MKITVCGSAGFFEDMLKVKKQLEELGHEVKLPPSKIKDDNGNMIPVTEYYNIRKNSGEDAEWVWEEKTKAMRNHFDKVEWSDVILVLNNNKKDVKGYIGANTLLEMGLAFHLGKNIFLFNDIPEIDSKEEIIGMKPIVINQDLTKIK